MDVLAFATLSVTGFAACAEFGSYAFVHPVLRHLPREHHIRVEKGLLRTFGRVMPVLMTLCVVISTVHARRAVNAKGLHWLSAASFTLALLSTVIFNVPINRATGRWDPAHPPENWKEVRNKWEFFQGLRSWLLLIGFILQCAAVSV
jgi:uncharacterized membrane protein